MTLFIIMEEWRDVPGTKGVYQIDISTKEGRCRSFLNKNGKATIDKVPHYLSNTRGKGNRIFWHLTIDGKTTTYQAARWIAITFPELVQNEYFEGAVIDHIDTDVLNNHPSNLRWVTVKENNNNPLTRQHSSQARIGKQLSDTTRHKLSVSRKGKVFTEEHRKNIGRAKSVAVLQYNMFGEYVHRWDSATKAAEELDLSQPHITDCCKGNRKSHGGFVWRYE